MPRVTPKSVLTALLPFKRPKEASEADQPKARKIIPEAPENRLDQKSLRDRKLTKLQWFISLLNWALFKPVGILQGAFRAVMPDFILHKKITEAQINKCWKRFNDPSKAYILLFLNTNGRTDSTQHAAIVMGSTKGKGVDDTSSYASWNYDPNGQLIGPFLAESTSGDFKTDYLFHGEPLVFEIPDLDVTAMKNKWDLLKKRQYFYQLIGFNCSSVAARLIWAGVRHTRLKDAYVEATPTGFWTPYDVCRLSERLKSVKGRG